MSHVVKMLEGLLPIQSYVIRGGNLRMKLLGSSIFSRGEQQKSLERIVEAGFTTKTLSVILEGKEVPVYLVARYGVEIDSLQGLLQQLAEGSPELIEWSNFNYHVREVAGLGNFRRLTIPEEQLWLHFGLDIFWTLQENIYHELTLILVGKQLRRTG